MSACIQTRTDGGKCDAAPMTGSRYCFLHSPDPGIAVRRDAATRKGGKASHVRWRKPLIDGCIEPTTALEVTKLMAEVLGKLGRGEVDPDRARIFANACKIQLEAIKVSKLEQQLKELKQQASGGQ